MIPVLGLAVGVILGLLFHPTVPLLLQPYLPIAVVAALDAVFGGLRARLDGVLARWAAQEGGGGVAACYWRRSMQSQSRFFDDVARVASGAVGALSGVRG